MKFEKCPRCREYTYERLKTHSYCANCNYSPDDEVEAKPLIPAWAKNIPNSTLTITLMLGLFLQACSGAPVCKTPDDEVSCPIRSSRINHFDFIGPRH